MSYVDWITNNGHSFLRDTMFGGVVVAYPIFMFLGIVVTIICSIIKFKIKGIPLQELQWAIMIVVPAGILGGTIFGKIFISGIEWYRVFFFWEPGMSLFGALVFGIVSGFAYLYRRSKVTLISMWVYADCILPNLLLGQAIGRWGNFYNHEILGQPVNIHNFDWLPGFIKNKMFSTKDIQLYLMNITGKDPSTGVNWTVYQWFNVIGWDKLFENGNGTFEIGYNQYNFNVSFGDLMIHLHQNITYREPIFLYESFANVCAWILIVLALPFTVKILSKPKPWSLEPKAYPGWFNKQTKTIAQEQLVEWSTQLPIKYKASNKNQGHLKMSLTQAWNKAYYLCEPNQVELNNLFEVCDRYEEQKANHLENLKKARQRYKAQLKLENNKARKDKLKQIYLKKQQDIYKIIGSNWRAIEGHPHGVQIEQTFNPYKFQILRSGVLTGLYIVIYLVIRISLETRRDVSELFIQNALVIDFIILSLILLTGITIVYLTQFVAPIRWRNTGWLYERSY